MQDFVAASVLLALTGGCAREPPLPRVVVFSPELARVLVDLDAAAAVVGADERSSALPELAGTASIGPLDAGAVERAAALHPAVALALARAPEQEVAKDLSARGVPVETFDPRSMDDVIRAIRRIGFILGRAERARELTERMLIDIAKTAVARDGQSRLTIVWVVDREPLTVVGATGLLHDLLELAGAENAVHGRGSERVVLDGDALAALRYDAIVDTSTAGDEPVGGNASARTLRIPPDVAALPAFDLPRRVRVLHERLYPTS